MIERPEMDRDELLAWIDVLDDLTYYQILDVDFSAGDDDVQAAFHRFAEAFHPDGHGTAPPDEQHAAHTIFKRGVEAYRVLSDAELRAVYDEALGEGDVRPPSLSSMRPPRPAPREDVIREELVALSARPFARLAEELARSGDHAQAKLYLQLALFHDPESETLQAFRGWLEKMAWGKE